MRQNISDKSNNENTRKFSGELLITWESFLLVFSVKTFISGVIQHRYISLILRILRNCWQEKTIPQHGTIRESCIKYKVLQREREREREKNSKTRIVLIFSKQTQLCKTRPTNLAVLPRETKSFTFESFTRTEVWLASREIP